ncbi:MAG: MBL fold metallo-hydrolase [Aeoliella sp.]
MSSLNSPDIARIPSVPFDENTYVVTHSGRDDCVVVDPGLEPEKILAHLDQAQLTPSAILCTHGHSDHIAGNKALKSRWPDCPLVIGTGDAYKLTDPVGNLSAAFGLPIQSPPADVTVAEGDTYDAAGLTFRVLETPGHSAGHVVFVIDSTEPTWLLGGDMLFHQSIGRTDFPDGDPTAMEASIREKLYTLPDNTIVYPGHGPETTIGFEKQHNPFVSG